MAIRIDRPADRRRPAAAEPAFTYRGVTIPPVTGSRSPLAEAIRDGLRGLSERSRGVPEA